MTGSSLPWQVSGRNLEGVSSLSVSVCTCVCCFDKSAMKRKQGNLFIFVLLAAEPENEVEPDCCPLTRYAQWIAVAPQWKTVIYSYYY